ncbi:transcription factor SOX-9-like isoform X2 [Zootermopsis nevadensis]|uniref:transcription factor SOX-9-like isoform X2 n=1 Tax=Zootermopsis nevadensis TaxID=136037 RepID=UPI000B8E4496|nr:transcription factor SOX-9-like isoform X2 [Zootermopsis nevadensis]
MAVRYPHEDNKEISVRLGAKWRALQRKKKNEYFALARQVHEEHKKKYPDYVYTPKEARMRKFLREQSRETKLHMSRCQSAVRPLTAAQVSNAHQHQWGVNRTHQGIAGRQVHGRQGPISSRMLAEQQRKLDVKKAFGEHMEQGLIQGYTETYMDSEPIQYHQMANHKSLPVSGDSAVITETDSQQWLPYMQVPQPGSSYMMRGNEDARLQQGGPWTEYMTETRGQEVPPYPLRQQMMNGSYGNCTQSQQFAETPGGMHQAMVNHNDRGVGSNGGGTTERILPHQYVYHQQQPESTSALVHNMVIKEEMNGQDEMRILEMIPISSENSVSTIPITTLSAGTTTITSQTAYNAGNNQQTVSSSNKTGKNSPASETPPNTTEISGALSDISNVAGGVEDSSVPLPAFEQAFGSTEIGRYSHEGFFNTTQQPENNPQSTNNQVSINSALDYNYYMGPAQIPTFESTMHYHQNQLQGVNQYSGFYNYYNYNYNELHQHFSYGHNRFSHLNSWASSPIKYENVLNY